MTQTRSWSELQLVQDVRWLWQTYGTEIVLTIIGLVVFGGWAAALIDGAR